MKEVTVQGHVYRIGKLSAMEQFHVGRRIAPLVATYGMTMDLDVIFGQKAIDVEQLVGSLGPISHVLAAMNDETTDYIIATCLKAVQRREDGGQQAAWANVSNGAQIMYADIELLGMVRLVVAVLRENLGDFMRELIEGAALKSSSPQEKATA